MTYNCPINGEPFEIDPETVEWGDDGTARIDCPLHSDSVCGQCWANAHVMVMSGGFESVTDAYYEAMRRAEATHAPCTRPEVVRARFHQVTIARPATAGFGA